MLKRPLDTLKAKAILSFLAILLMFFLSSVQPGFSSILSFDTNPQKQSESGETNSEGRKETSSEQKTYNSDPTPSTGDSAPNLQTKIPGVGAFLGTILDSLTSLTTDSEGRFKTLAANFPNLFPDLYKVFILL